MEIGVKGIGKGRRKKKRKKQVRYCLSMRRVQYFFYEVNILIKVNYNRNTLKKDGR